MNDRDRILERIKAVQALAERGDRGEKDNAAAMLERLMKQYGITETELAEDRRELAWFRFKTPLERRLLNQIIYAVTGRIASGCVGAYTNRTRKKLGIECTAAERLEIELSFEFYNTALEKELDRFYLASKPVERVVENIPEYVRKKIEGKERRNKRLEELENAIGRELDRLTYYEKAVVLWFYVDGATWEQISGRLNYSPRQCRNIRDKALDRLGIWFSANKAIFRFRFPEK